MGGGLLQLVAFGAQDAYITGNPHITFWKVLYKRHTNFAVEAFRVNFTGAPQYGQRLVAVVNRNADLIWKTYVEIALPDMSLGATDPTWTRGAQRRIGYLMLKQVEVEIGGQVIDRQYGEWLYLWETLTADFNTAYKLDGLVGGGIGGTTTGTTQCRGRPDVLYVPLQFWFNRNPGLALPLIALQYHEVRFNITLADATDLVSTTGFPNINAAAAALPAPKDMALYIDYVYLDVEERRRFAQESHEYLIEQVQYTGQQTITSGSGRLDLTLNHPVKELIWVFQDARYTDCSAIGVTDPNTAVASAYTMPFTYSDIVNRARLQINGQDRFDERFGDYFWKVQPYQHHTAGGVNPNFGVQSAITITNDAGVARDALVLGRSNPINVYSFAIEPEEHQPSGTCNFSRIDTATLVFDSVRPVSGQDDGSYPSKAYPYNFRIYAVNYNIFRIMSGMGGLAYSN